MTSKAEMEERQHLQRTHDENGSESKKSIVSNSFCDLSFWKTLLAPAPKRQRRTRIESRLLVQSARTVCSHQQQKDRVFLEFLQESSTKAGKMLLKQSKSFLPEMKKAAAAILNHEMEIHFPKSRRKSAAAWNCSWLHGFSEELLPANFGTTGVLVQSFGSKPCCSSSCLFRFVFLIRWYFVEYWLFLWNAGLKNSSFKDLFKNVLIFFSFCVFKTGFDKTCEQGMRAVWTRTEFWMVLHADIEGVICIFDGLN